MQVTSGPFVPLLKRQHAITEPELIIIDENNCEPDINTVDEPNSDPTDDQTDLAFDMNFSSRADNIKESRL